MQKSIAASGDLGHAGMRRKFGNHRIISSRNGQKKYEKENLNSPGRGAGGKRTTRAGS
jgi:hypothetical protein